MLSRMIRHIDDHDRPEIERLTNAFGEEIAAMDPLRRLIRADGFGRFYVDKMLADAADAKGLVLIAEEQGQIVGIAAGAARSRREKDAYQVVPFHDGYVTELYVVPEARHRGIGTAMVEACERWFRENGCGAVHIEVFAPNDGAVRFYRRRGYEARDIHQIKTLDSPGPSGG
jgi:ribosomal protein S18 acetylase RimI-like enzyme